MPKALFVKREDIVRNTAISGNLDTDKFIQFISIAQDIHVQNYTGTKLYDKISTEILNDTLAGDYLALVVDYIQPMLIHFAMTEYLPFAAYTVANGGVFKHISENSTNAEKIEIDYLVEKERTIAQYYAQRFIDYMAFHSTEFPEYNENVNEDIYPDRDNRASSWVL
jgi:hypothetical protein